jgi:hypothetical protein
MDDGDWICLQCGTYYYVGLYQLPEVQQRVEAEDRLDQKGIKPAVYILANRQAVGMNIAFASLLAASGSVIK